MICKWRIFLFFIIFSFALSGCLNPAGYGRVKPAGKDMTLDHLVKNWMDYNIHWAGINVRTVNAILFGPKGNDLKFSLQSSWTHVETKEELSELIRWINVFKEQPPTLYKVLGPDNQTFGYIFMLTSNPLIKVVDAQTLSVSNVTQRNFDEFGT
jgi:hypothetical protein